MPINQWLKNHSDILFNTSSLIATMLVTSGLGFAYWWVAARFYTPEAVGLASAATSAMMLLSTLFLLGQGTLLLTELPRNKGREGPLISASVLVVGISTLIASVLFALLTPYISPQLAALGTTPQSILLFAVGASLAGVTVILDQAVIGLLRGGIQLWRNTSFALVKLVLVVVAALYLAQTSGMSIYTTWAMGNAISLLPIVVFLIRKKKWSLKYYIPQWNMIRRLGMASMQHHSLNLILYAPAQLLPLLVTVLLSAKMNAWFYIASMIANFVFSLSISLTTVLHAANAAQVTTLTQKTRLTVGLAFLSSLVIGAVLVLGAEPILGFFGSSYADNAAWCLRILTFASLPLIIKNHYIAIYRIRDKVAQAIVPIALGSLFELGLAVYGAHIGQLVGLSLAWVIALLIEALFMAPTVVTVLLGRNPSNPYLDEIATADTVILPAFNQQTGYIQLTTLGDVMALAEVDTILLPAVQLDPALTEEALADDPTIKRPKIDVKKAVGEQPASSNEQAFVCAPGNVLPKHYLARVKQKLGIVLDVVLYLIPLGAFLVWCLSLREINVHRMNDIGLISVFPPTLIGTLVVITASFCLVIRHPKRRYPALVLYFSSLIFMLYGVNTLIEEMPRFAVVYRHAGYTEYMMRTGTVDPTLDAYFSWPGFFSLNAFIVKIAGYHDILKYAMWSPVFYNVFYFGPLYIIFTSFTKDMRIVYLAIWFFYLTNWIGQDYFSPQGLGFFLYLVIIALLVKWFKTSPETRPQALDPRWRKIPLLARVYPWLTAPDSLTTPIQPQQCRALIVCILGIFAFIVFSHQLTPFFVILSVSALVICRRCRLWWFPLVMIVMTLVWIVFMTQTFLAGHSSDVASGFHLFSSFSQNVTNRVVGNPQHTFIARMRIYMSVLVWGCACISGFLRWRRGYQDATIVLLALAPFPFFIVQPYGGEMLLRSYLFSLPSMVFLMAAFFYTIPLLKKDSWRVVASVGLCLTLLGGFFYTRYGNENMDYMTNDEVAGVAYLYSVAPSNSLFLGGWDGAPWQHKAYEKYMLVTLNNPALFQAASTQDVSAIVAYLRSHSRGNAYVLFTRSQKVTFNSLSGLPPGLLDHIEEKIAASRDFNLIYRNPDAQIYQFIRAGRDLR